MTRLVVTDGIVLGKRGMGEANAGISVLTEKLGLVRAAARSSRRESSKLRYGLEPFTAARFSFVRGKHEWKLTGVEKAARPLLTAPSHARAAGGRVSRLLLRLIHGEEVSPALFVTVSQGLELLAASQTRQEAENLECVLVLRALSHLGYVPQAASLSPFTSDLLSPELALRAGEMRPALIRAINESLSATGL